GTCRKVHAAHMAAPTETTDIRWAIFQPSTVVEISSPSSRECPGSEVRERITASSATNFGSKGRISKDMSFERRSRESAMQRTSRHYVPCRALWVIAKLVNLSRRTCCFDAHKTRGMHIAQFWHT